MKLATLKDGSRDGRLVVVSHDLTRCTDASFLAPTLQAALDDWNRVSPHLGTLAQSLEVGAVPWIRFHEHDAQSPLPRAYQHIGCGDAFVGPRDGIDVVAGGSLTVSATVAALCGDVARDTGESDAIAEIALVALVTGASPADADASFAALSPVAVTPDELGEGFDGTVALPLHVGINGKAGTGQPSRFALAAAVATAAKLRPLSAGAIVAALESSSHTVGAGDTIRVEMKDSAGHSLFGAIEQSVAMAGHP